VLLRRWTISAILAMTIFCFLAGCGEEAEQPGGPAPGDGAMGDGAPAPDAELGKTLFKKHCDQCHGEKGKGDGKAAYLLYPRPRDFSRGVFRIVTTDNGVPSDEDLLGVIERGMPGSAMPSWEHLPEADRLALVAEVRRLVLTSGAEELIRITTEAGDPISMEEALEIAGKPPGAPITLSREPATTPESVVRGRALYKERCEKCHDEDGRGKKRLDMVDSFGFKIRSRDFTAGVFKGGATAEEIAYRLLAGMPGTPMPKTEIPPEDLWPMVQHVRAMIRPGAQERVEQKQRTIKAEHARGALPKDAADPAWESVSSTYLALMPLWWRDDRVEGVDIRAVHDGRTLALLLTWKDPTRDQSVVRQTDFSDAAAVQFATDPSPPFFAMGEEKGTVEIWHWKAVWELDTTSGYGDVEGVFKNATVSYYDSLKQPSFGRYSAFSEFATSAHDPTWLPGWHAGNPLSDPERKSTCEALVANGFGTLTTAPGATGSLTAKGSYSDGTWRLVLTRPLDVGKEGLSLTPGDGVKSIGLAVWDGSGGDRNGQKSVTIWHKLVLVP